MISKNLSCFVAEQKVYNFPFVPRSEWSHRPPAATSEPLAIPVPYVVIHHTYVPGACNTTEQCSGHMRAMQNEHMLGQGWFDIGYNFCVGGDGAAYEGRGWAARGVHAGRGNALSLGICLIGDWSGELPPTQQLETTKALIAAAVELGVVSEDHRLVGHRQMTDSDCPGDALFEEIMSWKNFSPIPAGPEDPL
ncbi:Peptidoglycan-recognition protein LB [Eumeta japonica]|uniref:Peptidoglycan-recognition protein n=1 Tax=Eumeta variegata TaxID=151549 RepID=A0A4C1UM45_EUMVA|nr:Peptidoglycan-recognition protein LB [Eumeta japonica]